MSNKSEGDQKDRDQRAYEALSDRMREQIRGITEFTGDSLNNVIDRAKQATASAGEYTPEELERVSNFLRRDLVGLGHNIQEAGAFVRKAANPSRVKGGFLALASDLVTSAGDALTSLGQKFEEPIRYNTGEVTGPGTLKCMNCDGELHFVETGRVPPCPKCHKTEFRKSY